MSLIAIILLILAFFGLGSFASSGEVVSEPAATVVVVEATPWEPVELDGIQGVIVAVDAVGGFGLPEPYWSPSQADVAAAEHAITALEGDLDHYRQYAGFTEDGDRKIMINGFCNAEPDWTSQIVFVMDGGDCYFTGIYNVETADLEVFMYNGDA
jgi:hypothetical protein